MTLPQKQLYDKSDTAIQPIVERFIDTTSVTPKQWNIGHQADQDGWVQIGGSASAIGENQWYLLIDDVVVVQFSNGNENNAGAIYIVPIKKGQVYKGVGGIGPALNFYPCK